MEQERKQEHKFDTLDKSDAIATFLGTVHGKKTLANILHRTGVFSRNTDSNDVGANALRNFGMEIVSWIGPDVNAADALIDGMIKHVVKEKSK